MLQGSSGCGCGGRGAERLQGLSPVSSCAPTLQSDPKAVLCSLVLPQGLAQHQAHSEGPLGAPVDNGEGAAPGSVSFPGLSLSWPQLGAPRPLPHSPHISQHPKSGSFPPRCVCVLGKRLHFQKVPFAQCKMREMVPNSQLSQVGYVKE